MGRPRPGTIVEVAEETDARLALPWNVVVHDDPINLMIYVTHVFMRIFGYPREKAERHMLEVHRQGRSVLWTGAREQAEVYVMKLHSSALQATLERVDG